MWVWKICWRKDRLPTPVFLGSLVAKLVKNPSANVGDLGSIPGFGRSPVEGKGYPLQYSGLENSMDYTVHEVAKSWTQLRDFHFHQSSLVSNSAFTMCWGLFGLTSISSLHTRCGPAISFYFAVCAFTLLPLIFLLFFFFFSLSLFPSSSSPFFLLLSSL